MNSAEAQDFLVDMASYYGKTLDRVEVATWMGELSKIDSHLARAAKEKITQNGDSWFPTPQKFVSTVEVCKSQPTRPQRKIEIEPGVWVDYAKWREQQESDKRYWDRYSVSDEDRTLNVKRLQQAFEDNFGTKREVAEVQKRTDTKPTFDDEPPLAEPPSDWGYDDEPY